MTDFPADKLRIEVHTGDGKTITDKDDWTVFLGDLAIMDEDGFRSLDGPPVVARSILAMAEREKRMREALEQIAGGKMAGWKSGEVAQQALGKDQA